MRIVQLVETLEIGGLERLAVDLAQEQKSVGHLPSIYCVFHHGALATKAKNLSIPVIAFEKKRGFAPRTVWEMARRLRQERVAVVHTHNAGIHHYGVAAAKIAGVPVVVNTRHGQETDPKNPRAERIFSTALWWTDQVVMVSQHTRAFFIRERGFPTSKTTLIQNGIPLERFAAHTARPGSHRPRIRFGTVSRLVPAKDHATLLEAFAKVSARLPDAELHLLGDGPLRSALADKIVQLGLQERVRMHGASGQVEQFLSTLDVFVLSSITEGLPLAVLEAMAAGLPIVSTNVGGVPEVLPEGVAGWLCPPGQPDAMAQKMEHAAGCSNLASIGQEARRWAHEKFGIGAMWSRYHALFEAILSRKNSARVVPHTSARAVEKGQA